MFDTMMTRDIRQTLYAFRQSVYRLFSYVVAGSTPAVAGSEYAFTPVIESSFNENELMLRAILPGVTEKDVQVTVQNGRLVIEGERKAPEGWGEKAWTKLAYGKFYAEIPVPTGLDLEKVSCRLHDGILDIQVPVTEQMKPRQIPIESGEQKALSASA
ncbi:MAG: Hsp20/alpha crystallin family protein [Chloroflexi bacterium]|nr:Hsp20/alpha crystallin family protein [Chloroflexota bacterium]